MRYSIEPRYQIVVKCYGFLLFTKIVGKNLNRPSGQKLLDSIKKMHSKLLQKDHQSVYWTLETLKTPKWVKLTLKTLNFIMILCPGP